MFCACVEIIILRIFANIKSAVNRHGKSKAKFLRFSLIAKCHLENIVRASSVHKKKKID